MRCHKTRIAAAFAATILLSSGLAGCKGRTMENMEPLGETVEVDVPVAPSADTVAADTVVL